MAPGNRARRGGFQVPAHVIGPADRLLTRRPEPAAPGGPTAAERRAAHRLTRAKPAARPPMARAALTEAMGEWVRAAPCVRGGGPVPHASARRATVGPSFGDMDRLPPRFALAAHLVDWGHRLTTSATRHPITAFRPAPS